MQKIGRVMEGKIKKKKCNVFYNGFKGGMKLRCKDKNKDK